MEKNKPQFDNLIRILIVDDDRDFVASMQEILELENYPVAVAYNAAEALTKTGEFNPDVAMVDIKLGQESGLGLISQLQEVDPELTCITVTAYADTDTAIHALKAGVYDYLRKPFEASELFAVLHRCADRHRLLNEKRLSEKAMQESEWRFQVAFETSPDAIILAYSDGRIIDVNPGFEKLTGHDRHQVIGSNSAEIGLWKNPAERLRLLELLSTVGHVNNFEAEFRLSNGNIRIGLLSARVVQLEGAQAALFVVRDIHDIKLRENAITESEERFRGLVSHIPGAVYRCLMDADWTMEYISGPVAEISGHPAADFVQNRVRSFASIIHPDDRELVAGSVAHAVAKKEPFEMDYRIIHASGSIRWVYEKGRAIFREDGSLNCLDGVIVDTTASKLQEQLLAHIVQGVAFDTGEEFFRGLISRLSQVLEADIAFVARLDPNNGETLTTLFAVDAGLEIDNFSYAVRGTPCENVVGGEVCTFTENVQTKFPDDQLLSKMGVHAYVGAPLIGRAGSSMGLLAVLYRHAQEIPRNIEQLMQIYAARVAAELERLDAEDELTRSELRYRDLSQEYSTVLDGIQDAIFLIDPHFNVVWANLGATTNFAFPAGKTSGVSCDSIWGAAGERSLEGVRWVFESTTPVDTILKTADGKSWGVKTFPVTGADGTVVNVIQIASDLTEKIRLRDQATRSAHLAALGELAAGVAHEINNPTGMILLNMPMVGDAFKDLCPLLEKLEPELSDTKIAGLPYSKISQELPLVIDEMQEGAQRIKRIVEELKDFSKPATGEQDTIDLNDVVNKAVSLVRNPLKKATDHFTERYSVDPLYCHGNAQRLEQVLVNLLLNSCQALPGREGGIQVETSIDAKNGSVRVTVRDEGVGIPTDILEQITDPFFTTRREVGGTGLGLSVSSRIIDEHKGTLSFESTSGEGTTVIVELPSTEKAS